MKIISSCFKYFRYIFTAPKLGASDHACNFICIISLIKNNTLLNISQVCAMFFFL